jgi:hypothetical protein
MNEMWHDNLEEKAIEMNDYKKIRILHDLRNTFSVDQNTLKNLAIQIGSPKFRGKIERFYDGYTEEDNFHLLYSALPWVKLLHSLGETQLPDLSKKDLQVPDFLLFFETSKKTIKPLFIDVKCVKKGKETLDNLMVKQFENLSNYGRVLGVPILYAIYWKEMQCWTLNTIEHFEKKKSNYKISLQQAFTNDISVILGDISFLINHSIIRKSICDSSQQSDEYPVNEKYGSIIKDEVSINGKDFFEITPIESAIIDSTITMKITKQERKGSITEIIEESDIIYMLKLSTLIMRHLAVFGTKLSSMKALLSRHTIHEFMGKLGINKTYMLPIDKTATTDLLFSQAFESTWVLDSYNSKRGER